MKKSIMIQGTASNAGKSILAVALCRIFKQDGYKVSPFKGQNMSLNSGVTPEGKEMGRAQIMQAEAAGVVPSCRMNPILLKPTSDRKSQVILLGEVYNDLDAVDYFDMKKKLKGKVANAYKELENENDIVVIEGAGSPAEINLSDEYVNMGMAKIADSPVLLVGDIDKGGVFASLYGTVMLLPEEDRRRIKGLIINKFRGSVELLKPGLKQIEELTGIPVVGVVPHFNLELEDEDSAIDFKSLCKDNGELKIGVLRIPYMSNFTDLKALSLNPGVSLKFVELDDDISKFHLIIIPGSKSTIEDLRAIKSSKMDKKLIDAYENGAYIFGICGGYQMLGKKVYDSDGIDGNKSEEDGLGFFEMETSFNKIKRTVLSEGKESLFNTIVKGYEIHQGISNINEKSRFINNVDHIDGIVKDNGRLIGTYYHGIFDNGEFTLNYLNMIRRRFDIKEESEVFDYWEFKDNEYNKLASIVREALDINKIYKILNKEERIK